MFEKRYADAVPIMEQAAPRAPSELPNSFRLWGNLGDAYWLAKQDPQRAREAWLRAAGMVEQQLAGNGRGYGAAESVWRSIARSLAKRKPPLSESNPPWPMRPTVLLFATRPP